MNHSPKTVAAWMLEEVKRNTELYQEEVVYEIEDKFGQEFTYDNENGNLAIDKKVLAEFRKISSGEVVWERSTRMWRLRTSEDEPGRQQY